MSQYLTAKEAGQRFPKPLSANSVIHRMKNGIRGVPLKFVHDGNQYLTTTEWIDEFIQKSSEKRAPMFPNRIPVNFEADLLELRAMKHAYKRNRPTDGR